MTKPDHENETHPNSEVRVSKLRSRARFYYAVVWVPMLGFLLAKWAVPDSVIPERVLGSSALAIAVLIVVAVGMMAAIYVRCEYCGKGWADYQQSGFGGFFLKKSKVWNYPNEIPEKCPTCGALFK